MMNAVKESAQKDCRILLGSNYNSFRRPYNTISYEFCKVVSEIDSADIVAPDNPKWIVGQQTLVRATSRMRRIVKLAQLPTVLRTPIEKDYELFIFICPFLKSLVELARFPGWRKHSRTAAVFILESWSNSLAENAAYLTFLDQFDHVFLFNRTSVPHVQSHTKTPCSYLSVGSDCLVASPYPNPPERSIDVYSMGRRSEAAHHQFFEMAQNQEIHYMYDSLVGGEATVPDWGQHRFLTSSLIKRSRYFIAYNHSAPGEKSDESAGEYAMSARIFEGATGGAAMLGSAPLCSEYEELFDWPNATIEIPTEPAPEEMRAILKRLDAEPERMEALRRNNAVQALRRLDWSYRWEEALRRLGLAPMPALKERQAKLHRIAAEAERAGAAPSLHARASQAPVAGS